MRATISIWAILLGVMACREPLVITQDEEKQQLLLGNWTLNSATPPTTSSVLLTFNTNLTVDITVQADSLSQFSYFFRVEEGDLYFRSTSQTAPAEFIYNIDFLSPSQLILSFNSGLGERVVQDYRRP